MPELAEVEFSRRIWEAGMGAVVRQVTLRGAVRDFLGTDPAQLQKSLKGKTLRSSEAHGKQMLFKFSGGIWLGLHLGMSGSLRSESLAAPEQKHDHLVLYLDDRKLVFNDPRQFGRVLFHQGGEAPEWWRDRPPGVLSRQFTPAVTAGLFRRRPRRPVKAVLLMQECFPGVGNWMADEILWRAQIYPAKLSGRLRADEIARLHAGAKFVCREAMRIVGTRDGDLPKGWFFHQRWKAGGLCPRDGAGLKRAAVGGRTTAWCPHCQKRGGRV